MKDLFFKLLPATEKAAMAAYETVGCGDEMLSDKKAVDAMRNALNQQNISGTIVIGEGERDNAPMLYIGEKVGTGVGNEIDIDIDIDIALDPLEGTTICAHYKSGALSVIAATKKGGFLYAPDVYMEKIAVGKNLSAGVVSLHNTIEDNLHNLASAKKCSVRELTVTVLKRERHLNLIDKIRKCGARIKLIDDGDVSAIISVLEGHHDLYVGIGGAPEGVLAASALHSIGGQMEGRLIIDDRRLNEIKEKFSICDANKVYGINDLVSHDSVFVATGVTDGDLVNGIKYEGDKCVVSSIVIQPKNIMYIKNIYYSSYMLREF